ncbi:hypothetical protein BDR03DRAFT_962958 [Suillus americanus]|nr:hypothetical protein BDR03DRAFT_962958 [Suillus americanus]
MTRWPSPSEKGWVLQCYCGGTAEDIHLRQCAGCHVVRYCSKRCQRDSWYSHHRLSCNFLKAAVGESFQCPEMRIISSDNVPRVIDTTPRKT